ncbi:MAG TPA: RNA polymerase sigma factor [Gemmataceae bacterium]|jgi:RNA polymerase sigma-70 factor (ECF subfamily)
MTSVDTHQLGPLIRRALSGDVGAWNDFFREIRKYLHAEIRRVLGTDVQGPLDHSAIAQSTLRRVWEQIGEQFPDGPNDVALRRFLAWISTIVRNRSWEEWRRRNRHPVKAVGSAIEHVAEPCSGERRVNREHIAAELAAALARLPEKHRQVVELFWFERLSDSKISERLGCSEGAIRVLRFRALRKLQTPKLRSLLEDSHDAQC